MKLTTELYEIMRPMPVFKPEMRLANQEGRKSQTRRVIDPQPIESWVRKYDQLKQSDPAFLDRILSTAYIPSCKYGKVGDISYMREPLKRVGAFAWYVDDNTPVINSLTGDMLRWRWKKDLLTSIFMPKDAARFIYQYEFIRVERVQEISRDDAKAEGVSPVWAWDGTRDPKYFERGVLNPYVANYSVLWDEINERRGFGWDVNPWVWVLGYKPVEVRDAS
jgi:hypothetical protein